MIRNTLTGQLRLEMEKKMFIPNAKEEVEEVRKKIILEDSQVAILKTIDGRYIFKGGKATQMEDDPVLKEFSDDESSIRAFFVPPFCELVKLEWFKGDGIDQSSKIMSIFDMRPTFLNYSVKKKEIIFKKKI